MRKYYTNKHLREHNSQQTVQTHPNEKGHFRTTGIVYSMLQDHAQRQREETVPDLKYLWRKKFWGLAQG